MPHKVFTSAYRGDPSQAGFSFSIDKTHLVQSEKKTPHTCVCVYVYMVNQDKVKTNKSEKKTISYKLLMQIWW